MSSVTLASAPRSGARCSVATTTTTTRTSPRRWSPFPRTSEPRLRSQLMLFDLRGRRRRLIQAIYLMLAVLIGGGLVLFGIGGNVGGGLVDAISGNSGNSSGS